MLPWATDGQAYFALERSAGIIARMWVNGVEVYSDYAPHSAAAQPLLSAPLHAGGNTLLLKLDCNAATPTFSLRALTDNEALLLANARAPRELRAALEAHADTLIVNTGDLLTALVSVSRGVAIRVAGAGGRAVGAAQVKYGEPAHFDTTAWPDGGYDVTCRLLATPRTDETRDADATPAYTHLLWYKGDVLSAAQRLVAAAPGDDAQTALIHTLLVDLIYDRLGRDFSRLSGLWDVYPALMEWEELQLAAQTPAKISSDWFIRLAYRSEIDDAPQFARLYLPPGYDPAKSYPLIVSLHGMYRENPPYIDWFNTMQRYEGLADRYNAIVLYPHGRGNAWYRGLGDADVLRCIELARQRCAIDPDRIYLMGYSMGGAGVWHVGAAHPELFAAIAPFYGGREPQVTSSQATLDAMTPREKRYAEKDSSFAQCESLRSTPAFVCQGDQDTTVIPETSRYAVRLLHNWGYTVNYWEMPGKGHEPLLTEDVVLPWLLAQRRVAHPTEVRLRAWTLAGACAHWLRVQQRDKQDALIQADAAIIGPNLIRLDTENVLAIRLNPGDALIDPHQPLRVLWNDVEAKPAAVDDAGILFYAAGYTPAATNSALGNFLSIVGENRLEKTAAVEGPLGDIFNTPFLIVIGTASPDAAMRAYCQRYARREITWWQMFQQVTPRVEFDTQVSAAEMARYSLLLVGGPADNLLTRQLAGKLPLRIVPAGFIIDDLAFPVRDGGVRLAYPNPLNPERYVVVAAATSPLGMFRLPPFNNRYDVDFAVTDGRGGQEQLAGLFDRNWHVDRTLIEYGKPSGDLPPAPAFLSAAIPEKTLYLCTVIEERGEGDLDYLPGTFAPFARALSYSPKETYPHSLCMPYYSNPVSALEYNLYGGHWQHFRATLALEKPSTDMIVSFIVKGDGKVLYRSPPCDATAPRRPIDIPIDGVANLRLEMEWHGVAATACWADARVEK